MSKIGFCNFNFLISLIISYFYSKLKFFPIPSRFFPKEGLLGQPSSFEFFQKEETFKAEPFSQTLVLAFLVQKLGIPPLLVLTSLERLPIRILSTLANLHLGNLWDFGTKLGQGLQVVAGLWWRLFTTGQRGGIQILTFF